jgi:hypothetical protein
MGGGGGVGRGGIGVVIGGRGAAGAGVGRGAAGAGATRGFGEGAALFLGAAFRAADLARFTIFLPAFRAFFAAAFTLRLTLAILPLEAGLAFRRAVALRRALLRGLAALRAAFFFAGFRADFFLAAALAMNHLREMRSRAPIDHADLPDARSSFSSRRRLARGIRHA